MMKIYTFPVGIIHANCYILQGEGSTDCVLVDPGAEAVRIEKKLAELKLKPTAVLLTHAHFDHAGAVRHFQECGAAVYMHKADIALFESSAIMANRMGEVFEEFIPDHYITDGQTLELCGLTFKVVHTPGHSVGCVCYMCEGSLFSGDTLFYMSIGRTDFPTGSRHDMKESLKKLFALNGDYAVYPGHGCPTKLAYERENNPYA